MFHRTQCPLYLCFYRTQHPRLYVSQDLTSFALCFIGRNVLCLYVSENSTSSVFMFHRTQCPLYLCFYRTQRPRLYVSQDLTSFALCFIGLNILCLYVSENSTSSAFLSLRTQHPLSLCFHRTQHHCIYASLDSMSFALCFIGLNILCLYVSENSTSSSFYSHRTQRPLSLCFHRTQHHYCLYVS